MSIVISELTKYYGTSLGVKNLSLELKTGDFMGFIGPNGSGKSTTLRLLLNIIFPTDGKATILGKNVVTDIETIKPVIGYLPSEIALYPEMTVQKLIEMNKGFYLKQSVTDAAIKKDSIFDMNATNRKLALESTSKLLVDMLKVDVKKRFKELSYGNKKKVGIVLAMMHQPKVIILDEPTNGLDPLVQDVFMNYLQSQHALGKTILFSSHTLSEVESNCKTVALIKDGNIIKTDSIDNLRQLSLKKISLTVMEKNLESVYQGLNLINGEVKKLRKLGNNKVILEVQSENEIHRMLNALGQMDIVDIHITDPSLEELFMHFYQ